MAKRPKVDEDKKCEGKENDANKDTNIRANNITIEDIICKVILFCSKEINRHPDAIKLELIPCLIKESKHLALGKVDLMKFRYLSNSQLTFLLTTFKDCIKIKVDHLVANDLLFKYLQNFKKLKKLTIFISENDNFTSLIHPPLLAVTSIKIVAKQGPSWDDSVEKILDQSNDNKDIDFGWKLLSRFLHKNTSQRNPLIKFIQCQNAPSKQKRLHINFTRLQKFEKPKINYN